MQAGSPWFQDTEKCMVCESLHNIFFMGGGGVKGGREEASFLGRENYTGWVVFESDFHEWHILSSFSFQHCND